VGKDGWVTARCPKCNGFLARFRTENITEGGGAVIEINLRCRDCRKDITDCKLVVHDKNPPPEWNVE